MIVFLQNIRFIRNHLMIMGSVRVFLILLLFGLHSVSTFAENLRFKTFTVNDGLPFNSVRSIIEDQQGYIWFGTELGLARYDGYSLKSYLSDNEKPNSIADPYILDLELTENNQLWISGEKGLSRYNRETDDFTVFTHDEKNTNSLSSNTITALQEDSSHILWIATDKGLDRFDTKKNQFQHFKHNSNNPLSIPSNKIRTLFRSKKGELWLGTNKGLATYNHDGGNFKIIKLSKGKQPSILSLAESRSGIIWIGTMSGLFQYNPSTQFVKKIQFVQDVEYVLSLLVDQDDNLWVGTFLYGIFRIDLNNKILNIRPDKSNATALTDSTILSIFQDLSGFIWLGTYNSGVNYFEPKNLNFGSFDNSINSMNCLISTNIYSALTLDNNTALLGTIEGLFEVDLKLKECKSNFISSELNTSLSNNEVYAIFKDSTGSIWVGTAEGLDKLDSSNGKFERFGDQINKIGVYKIIEHNNFLIFGGVKGLYKLNIKTRKIFAIPFENKSLQITELSSLDIDNNGVIWAASEQGLFTLDNKLKYAHQVTVNDKPLVEQKVRAMVIDKTNNIWLTLEGLGLFKYNIETQKLISMGEELGITIKDGFSGLYLDNAENLWLSTLSLGLFKIDRTRKDSTNYHVSDGLNSEIFNPNSFTKFSDGRLLFGGKTGFNIFDPTKIKTNQTAPIVSLTQLKRFGKKVVPNLDYDGFKINKHISQLDKLNLSHRETVFGFDFVATHYADSAKIKYAYRLEGFDQDWTYTTAQNRGVTYNNISPGDYTFQVKAQTKNGVWSKKNASINIIISPAPWLTWWAFTIYAIAFILSLIFFIKKRTQILEQRSKKLAEMVAIKTTELIDEKNKVEQLLSRKNEEFANVSHEFRTPLTLILGPLAQVLKTNKKADEINRLNIVQRNGYRLLRMVDQLLNLETFRIKSITQKSPQATGEIIRLLTEAFADLAAEKNIDLKVKKIVDINFDFTPDALEKIVLNLLSNAIKYSKSGGTITVETQRTSSNELTLQVKDTGIGIPQDKLDTIFERYNRVLDENSEQVTGAGIGLALVKELVKAHKGYIEIESELGVGTTITVYLPIIGEVEDDQVSTHANDEIVAMELMSLTHQAAATSQETNVLTQRVDEHKPLILVIEDNQDMRHYIVGSITNNYRVITAKNGEEGVNLAIEEIPDLIISDVMMPIMDGYQVTENVRKNQNTSHIPIILLTARGDRESRLKGWHQKADEYLTKPFDVEELLIRMQNLLEIREMLQKRFGQSLFQEKSAVIEQQAEEPDNRNEKEAFFLEKLNQQFEKHYVDAELKIEIIASNMAMSQRQLLRKLKGVLDLTPVEYLRRYRLEKARSLLMQGEVASNVAYDVGFSSHSHFGKCFKIQYGCAPSEYKEGRY